MSRANLVTKRRAPSGRPAKRSLPVLLRRAWYSLNQAFRRRIAHLDLTPDQYTVLRTLHEAGVAGLNQRALTELMSSDPNTVASLLDRMDGSGWIRRPPDPNDRRARRVQLRPEGAAKFRAARAVALGLQAEVLGVLDRRGRAALLNALARVADAAHVAAGRFLNGAARPAQARTGAALTRPSSRESSGPRSPRRGRARARAGV
jgi:DNA-binding MarR family transcriptional regulator